MSARDIAVSCFDRQAPGIGGALRWTGKTNVKAPGNPGISRAVHDLKPIMNLDEARENAPRMRFDF